MSVPAIVSLREVTGLRVVSPREAISLEEAQHDIKREEIVGHGVVL